jgi:PAS domain S-box-containing protein
MTADLKPEMIDRLCKENERLQSELSQLHQEHDRLQKSESYYRQIFENAPISILSIDPAGYITNMNQAAEALYGLAIEPFNQQACPVFENLQLVENGTLPYILRAFAGETIIELPTFYDTSRGSESGNLSYGRGHYFPLRDIDGNVEGIVEMAPDFKDFAELQQQLFEERDRAAQERNRLLSTVAQVANSLLKTDDYRMVLSDMVRLLGEAVGSDRCCITQDVIHPQLSVPSVQILTEWCRASVSVSIDFTPDLETALPWDNLPQFRANNLQGITSNYLITDLEDPARTILLEQGLTSILVVPIQVEGISWGQIGFDNCSEPKLYDEAEIAILKVAADSIAAAITRQIKEDQLRESEARYRALFEISSEGIYRFDFDQPIDVSLPVNEQVELIYQNFQTAESNITFAKMYGKSNVDELIGLRLTDIHASDSEQNQSFVRALIGNDYQIQNAESEEVSLTGTPCFFINNVFTVIQDGCAIGGWGSQLDITELRMAQQARPVQCCKQLSRVLYFNCQRKTTP